MRYSKKFFVVIVAISMILLGNTAGATFNSKPLLNTQTTREFSANDNSSLHTTKSNTSSYSLFGKLDDRNKRKNFLNFGLFGASGEDAFFNEFGGYGDFVFDEDSMELVIGVNWDYLRNYDNLVDIISRIGGKVVNTVSMKGKVIAIVVDAPLNAVSQLKREVQTYRLARYVEPNMKFQAQFVPNDPYWSMQWGPQKIEADWAWNTTVGTHDVLVAVIDTGIDYTHPDLKDNYVDLGYDWVNNDPDPLDDFGHGTHCAGIIAAVLNNSIGVAGVAQVRIMAEKGLDAYGSGTEDDLANAIIHAVDKGAKILSNSWGGYGESYLIHDAVQYAYNHSVLVIAAAGNEAVSLKPIPAGYEEVVAVTATDQYDAPAWFTNFGDWVEVAAPGVNIYSTMPTYHVTMNDAPYYLPMNYSYMSGTSMACPHAAGVAALIWSQFPNATRDWVRAQLRFTADDLGDSGFDKYYGYGRINARKAVEQVPPEHDVLIFKLKRTRHIYPEYPASFNVSILNFGTSDEENVEVQLLVNDVLNDSKIISQLPNGTLTTVALSWNPQVEGTYNITLYVVPVSGETAIENNVFSEMITIKSIIGNVTFEEAHLSAYTIGDNPAGDIAGGYGEFADYLASNGYIISAINPGTVLDSSVLASVDVLIIVAPMNIYSSSELSAIESWVKGGGKLLLISDWIDYGAQARAIAQRFGIILPGDGICDFDENVGYPYWPYYEDENLLLHPITTGVTRVEMYAGDGITSAPGGIPLIVTDSDGTAYWYFSGARANGISVMSAFEGGAVGSGKLVIMTDSNIWDSVYDVDNDGNLDFYDSDNEILALNSINWLAVKYEHELTVTLKAPSHIEPGKSTMLNATVYNWGLNNETDVQLQLFINDTLVNSVTISELVNSTSYTLNHSWTPIDVGVYNVTAYVPPVSGENITVNNLNTRYVHVQYPLINPIEGQYANYILNYYSSSGYLIGTGYWNLTYNRYVEPYKINVTLWQKDPYGYIYTYYMIVNTMNRYVESGIWVGLWYPGWIETDINIGSTINLLYSTATVNGSKMILFGPRVIDCWEIPYLYMYPYTFWYDKASGLWIRMDATNPYVNERAELILLETNVPIGTTYEHDLGATLDVPQRLQPGETSLLNATIYNIGLSNEANVEFKLFINGTQVANKTLAEFVNGTWFTINYSWTPLIEDVYNITAYAEPVSGEDVTINNIAITMVRVRRIEVALISDYTQLNTITSILESMNVGYDMYINNYNYLYTQNLSLLLKYKAVILYKDGRWITSTEYSALRSYLSLRGNLLLTGFDCLVSDSLFANLIRSSSMGDNVGEPDLYVVEETHPIMDGPYGSFQKSYHIHGLSSDCDMAEADTSKGAVTVAELADGYDKIIATEGLPGKVVFWNGEGTYDWTYNSDCQAMLKNTIHWFLVRYQHELVVSLQAPKYLEPGDFTMLNATVQNAGLNDETNVELQLLINGTIVKSQTISFLQNGTSYTLSYSWTPTIAGKYNITVYAPPVPNENITRNNMYSKIIPVQYAPKILAYVQYTDYYYDYPNTLKVIESTFGPNYEITELWDYTQLNSKLPGKDILLIPDQEYASLYIMQTIGSSWSETLNEFLENGGIIILCDGFWGYGGTYGILTGAGLMSIASTNYRSYYTLYLVDPSDPLAEGVSQTFISPYYTVSFVTQETKVVVNDGVYPVVIRKEVGRGQIVLLGFDFESSNNNTERLLGNALALTTYITISLNPSAGSPGTKVTVTGIRASANGNVSIYWDGTFMANTTANNVGEFSCILTVPEDAATGFHEIMAVDVATGRMASASFRVVIITLNPSEGPMGTKVTVKGEGFTPQTQAPITFNDMQIGYASVDSSGNFTFIFNVPISTAEIQVVKAFEAEGYASATFKVLDVTPLDVQMDVGVMHFKGEIAEFYSQIVFKGTAVNATRLTAILYSPNGEMVSYSYPENITLIATGLYKTFYNIPVTAGTGTYTLVVTAQYLTETIQAYGTSFKSFLISDILTLMNNQITEIRDGIATVQTDLGFVRLNLTALNVTLENIFLHVIAINGTTATIQTTLGIVNGTITGTLSGDVATIVVPGLGQIQTDISNFKGVQEAWVIPQYVIIAIALIAAASSTLSLIFLIRRKTT